MSVVYRVFDEFQDREVALKLLRSDLSDDRLFRERLSGKPRP